MKYWILAILVAISVVLLGNSMLKREDILYPATLSGAISAKHVGPDYLYPDSRLTPGRAETDSFADLTKSYNGQTYSQAHRAVSSSEKKTICAEYPTQCRGKVEIDHYIPLAIGGSNDTANLWAQPEKNEWNSKDYGFHAKDKLETFLVIKVKKGDIAPKDAQQCIVKDWIACYNKYINDAVSFGAADLTDNETI